MTTDFINQLLKTETWAIYVDGTVKHTAYLGPEDNLQDLVNEMQTRVEKEISTAGKKISTYHLDTAKQRLRFYTMVDGWFTL